MPPFSEHDAVLIYDGNRAIPLRDDTGSLHTLDVPDGTPGEVITVLPGNQLYVVRLTVGNPPITGLSIFADFHLRRA